ncbi:hypothetical protein IW140_003249 [Coemansia sp. RSA 1813]|nr:hypothetical protein EV178_002503 [Coemansia sp. RSA 1646]KAJ1771402.1 hypothetical protein LPJ74_002330 [Coemansia sp. RSA 1843]KAJ2089163.1 hypothetical protein IW138_003621 [Coemansia sp. RSA 986]KAJ2213778.1 hypothetical protein EV179_003582 [Coemansia sp. RSA 487]KAJ2569271.1 hypothetical protein IW140_003249 [Coemansia sp. RSA 1813]
MDDSFNTYINQFLIDPSSADANSADNNTDMDVDKANMLGNDILLQLLLNSVNGPGAATVDPSSLNSFQINSTGQLYNPTPDDGASSGVVDTNSLLTEAFLSALGPLSYPAESSAAPANLMASAAAGVHENDELMAVDSAETATSEPASQDTNTAALQDKPKAQKPKPSSKNTSSASNPQKKTIQQQALSAATSKRASSTAGGPPTTASAPKNIPTTPRSPARKTTSFKSSNGRAESPNDESAFLEMAAESDGLEGVDLKSMSSKERRQIRNKISARNFRVRRKEYISNLEAEVRMHKEEADGLRKDLITSKKENQQLRDELQKLRQRFSATSHSQTLASPALRTSAGVSSVAQKSPQQQQQQATKPVAKAVSVSPAATSVVPPTMPPAAPMVRFNPHKDIGQSAAKKSAATGSTTTNGSWAPKNNSSGYITVNTTMLPVSFSTKFDEITMETRRKQAVDALLDIDDSVPEDDDCHQKQQQSNTTDMFVDLDPTVMRLAPAILGAASVIAELLLPQIALELSLTQPQTSSAGPPCASVQC